MTLLRQLILGAGLAALLAQPQAGRAVETSPAPDFKEVYDLVHTHLAGESESDLNRDSVLGLIHQLHGKVSLGNGPTGTPTDSKAPLIAKSTVYDGSIAYLRVGRVADGLAGQLTEACKGWEATNHLKGVVLDLRSAGGQDYSEAVAAANLFMTKEKPLLDWGNGVVRSKPNENAVTVPVAVLVNAQTASAAEALAAVLREADRALILGGTTAGEASMSQDYPLKNGQTLRIATTAIKLSDGETLAKGVKPDIEVTVSADDEKAYFADPYKEIAPSVTLLASLTGQAATNGISGTNRAPRPPQLNEAELMRERREKPGVDVEDLSLSPPANTPQPEAPVIRDPVLGRALDLIKGLSVMYQPHAH